MDIDLTEPDNPLFIIGVVIIVVCIYRIAKFVCARLLEDHHQEDYSVI